MCVHACVCMCVCVRARACVCVSRNSFGIYLNFEKVYPENTKLRILCAVYKGKVSRVVVLLLAPLMLNKNCAEV
jgi:hypothetical protein